MENKARRSSRLAGTRLLNDPVSGPIIRIGRRNVFEDLRARAKERERERQLLKKSVSNESREGPNDRKLTCQAYAKLDFHNEFGNDNREASVDEGDTGSFDEFGDDNDSLVGAPFHDAFCTHCGESDAFDMIQCSLCGGWMHAYCWESFHQQEYNRDDEFFICTSREQCYSDFLKLVANGSADHSTLHPSLRPADSCTLEAAGLPSTAHAVPERFERFRLASGALRRSALQRSRTKLVELQARHDFTYLSMSIWSETFQGLSRHSYDILKDTVKRLIKSVGCDCDEKKLDKALQDAAPPINIRRKLCDYVQKPLHSHTVSVHDRGQVEAFFEIQMFDGIDAAFDMYTSTFLESQGPMYEWNNPRFNCSAGVLPKEIPQRVRQFMVHHQLDENDPDLLIIPVILYADETVSKSGNHKACPLWMTISSLDPSTRASSTWRAHTLLSLLPVSSSIDYRFEGEYPMTNASRAKARSISSPSGSRREQLATELRIKSYEFIFRKFAEWERDGRKYVVGTRVVHVRVMIYSMVFDLKERRLVLGLLRNTWHCGACYDHPGDVLPADHIRLGSRSVAQDTKLRKEFADGKTRVTKTEEPDGHKVNLTNRSKKKKTSAQQFKDEYSRFGIPLKDECPITRVGPEESIWWNKGPYEKVKTDLLHAKDGWQLRHVELLIARLGPNFITQSKLYGNKVIHTGVYSMHVMEATTASFHFIPFAVLFGMHECELKEEARVELFLGCCTLLTIISLLNDPCPGYILEPLRLAIADYEKHLRRLIDAIENLTRPEKENGGTSETVPREKAFNIDSDDDANDAGPLGGIFEDENESEVSDEAMDDWVNKSDDASPGHTSAKRTKTTKKPTNNKRSRMRVTVKQHELMAHVHDQVESSGFLPALSSKLFETLHGYVFDLVNKCSSNRIADGSGAKEVLYASAYREIMLEIDAATLAQSSASRIALQNEPLQPVASFCLKNQRSMSQTEAIQELSRNLERTGSFLETEQLSRLNLPEDIDDTSFGTSLKMMLMCSIRKVNASLDETVVIPGGEAQDMFSNLGGINGLAYYNGADEIVPVWSRCKVDDCNCHHHNKEVHLFASSCRDDTTSYGIPVLFGNKNVYVVPLKQPKSRVMPLNSAILERAYGAAVTKIPLSHIRGTVLMRQYSEVTGKLFVYRYRKVFGYRGL